jgi:hypothetical protein
MDPAIDRWLPACCLPAIFQENHIEPQYVLYTTDGKLGYPDRETRSGNGVVSEIAHSPLQPAEKLTAVLGCG